jgi:NAD(P)-dependent dehydrogenase (short-subunit alcohol dehydrogenase family)
MNDNQDRRPKVWFISGISRGFGRELALAAIEQGDSVIGTTRNGQSDLDTSTGRLNVFALDVTHRQDVACVVAKAWETHGHIDIVVNNAGFGLLGAVEEESQARQVFETNFFGLLSVVQSALPRLRAQGSGHVINISSIGGFAGFPGYGLYSASKFAVEGLSEALAAELQPLGIHVTIVEPGYFRTNFLSCNSLQRASRVIEAYAATSGKKSRARRCKTSAICSSSSLAHRSARQRPHRNARGERRDQGRTRSSMTCGATWNDYALRRRRHDAPLIGECAGASKSSPTLAFADRRGP